jgi:hypothetical protein
MNEEQIKEILDIPWNLLPDDIRQWARDNGHVLRESLDESGNPTGATYRGGWREKYVEKLTNESTN